MLFPQKEKEKKKKRKANRSFFVKLSGSQPISYVCLLLWTTSYSNAHEQEKLDQQLRDANKRHKNVNLEIKYVQ